jgi:copper chaperone CopZ
MSHVSNYVVSGMTCDHCVGAVAEELTTLSGVRKVDVDLVPGGNSTVIVESDGPLDVEFVAAAVDEAGAYELVL